MPLLAGPAVWVLQNGMSCHNGNPANIRQSRVGCPKWIKCGLPAVFRGSQASRCHVTFLTWTRFSKDWSKTDLRPQTVLCPAEGALPGKPAVAPRRRLKRSNVHGQRCSCATAGWSSSVGPPKRNVLPQRKSSQHQAVPGWLSEVDQVWTSCCVPRKPKEAGVTSHSSHGPGFRRIGRKLTNALKPSYAPKKEHCRASRQWHPVEGSNDPTCMDRGLVYHCWLVLVQRCGYCKSTARRNVLEGTACRPLYRPAPLLGD